MRQVESIQFYNMRECGWAVIGCNFIVGGDGSVYESRGWLYKGAHTKEYNEKSIGIALLGTFDEIVPPKRQLLAVQKLIKEGFKLKMIAKDYRLYGHRQIRPQFNNPGLTLYKIIQKWNHWSAEIV